MVDGAKVGRRSALLPVLLTLAVDASAQVALATGGPRNESPVEVGGVAQQGSRLKAKPGRWRGVAPITFAYRWSRCDAAGASCVPIASATRRRYDVGADDVATRLRLAVTARDASGQRTRR